MQQQQAGIVTLKFPSKKTIPQCNWPDECLIKVKNDVRHLTHSSSTDLKPFPSAPLSNIRAAVQTEPLV